MVSKSAYEDAARKVRVANKENRNSHMMVELRYDTIIVLPYAAGLALLAALENAELYDDDYREGKTINPVKPGTFKTQILSAQEYNNIKVAQLLQIPLEQVEALSKPSKQEAVA